MPASSTHAASSVASFNWFPTVSAVDGPCSSVTVVGVTRSCRVHAEASRFDRTALFAPYVVRDDPQ